MLCARDVLILWLPKNRMTELVTSGSVGGMARDGCLYPEDGVECALAVVQGKARRRGMVILLQGVATQPCAAASVQSAP